LIAVGAFFAVAVSSGVYHLQRFRRAGREEQIVRGALANGRLDKASQAVERWLRATPDSAKAHFLKARVAFAQGDFRTADLESSRARNLGHPLAELNGLRGLLLTHINQLSRAEPLLREAFDSAPVLDPAVAEALAQNYLSTFRLRKAAEILDRWSRALPQDARPYLMQAEIDIRSDASPDAVIAHYRTALERDPNLPKARLGLADQLRRNHRYAEAAVEYTTYLKCRPDDPLGYLGAGQTALELSGDAEAAPLLDKALALAPHDPVALAARATVELRRGHFESALPYFDQAVKYDPFDYVNRYQRMLLLRRLGRSAEADAEHQTVEHLKNEQARFSQISRDLRRNPLDSRLRSEAACWLMEHGHEEEAVDWANLVLSTEPSHPAMNRLLADYYRKNGEPGLANFHEARAPDAPSKTDATVP
jgi:tetratricopeptide (TPR) repeat protein